MRYSASGARRLVLLSMGPVSSVSGGSLVCVKSFLRLKNSFGKSSRSWATLMWFTVSWSVRVT